MTWDCGLPGREWAVTCPDTDSASIPEPAAKENPGNPGSPGECPGQIRGRLERHQESMWNKNAPAGLTGSWSMRVWTSSPAPAGTHRQETEDALQAPFQGAVCGHEDKSGSMGRPKLKPRWNLHLRGDEDWLRRHGEALPPVPGGWSGAADDFLHMRISPWY